MECLAGLGTVNITCGELPIFCALGTGAGPASLWALEEADGRCVGSHYSAVQWPRDEGTLDRFDSAHYGGYRKAHKAQKGWAEPLEGAFHTRSYCGYILFFLNYGRQ